MIVSHEHKFIFIKTRKTAGTSIEIGLSKYCGPQDVITPIGKDEEIRESMGFHGSQNTILPIYQYRKWDLWNFLKGGGFAHHFNHTPAKLMRKRLGGVVFDNYLKFCGVRNPWDMAVSLYNWEVFGPKRGIDSDTSFGEFLYRRPRELLTNSSIFMSEGKVLVDDFVKFESLESDLQRISEKIGLGEIELPRAKSGFNKEKRHYSLYYDDENVEFIRRICNIEIELFGYEFDDRRSS